MTLCIIKIVLKSVQKCIFYDCFKLIFDKNRMDFFLNLEIYLIYVICI